MIGEESLSRYEREEKLSIYRFNRASDLRGAAGAVWFAMEQKDTRIQDALDMESGYSFSIACPSVFLMLCGLSLELLYKALIVERGGAVETVHKLRKLSLAAGLTMSEGDLALLDILTHYVVWAGKYPIPRSGEEEYKQLGEQIEASLYEPIPDLSIKIYRSNNRLDWADYSRIWEIGSSSYREMEQKRDFTPTLG
jgi:hypothetical protein